MSSKTQDNKGILWTICVLSFVLLLAISFLFIDNKNPLSSKEIISNVLVLAEGQASVVVIEKLKAQNHISEVKLVERIEGESFLQSELNATEEQLKNLDLPTTITFLSESKNIDLSGIGSDHLDQSVITDNQVESSASLSKPFGLWRIISLMLLGLLSIVSLGSTIVNFFKGESDMLRSLAKYGSDEKFIRKYLSSKLISKLVTGILIGALLFCAFVYLSNRYLGLSFLPMRTEYFIFIPILLIIVVYMTYKISLKKVMAFS